MSRFRKLSQTIWHCKYHIVWVPKYRYRILKGKIAELVEQYIRAFSEQLGGEIIELNVCDDHVHLLALVPPKVSISGYVGTIKGRTAIRILNQHRELSKRQFNHLLGSQAVNGGPINVLRKKCAVFIRRLDQGQLFKYVSQVAEGFKSIGLGGFNQA